jgi:hypothetical protein
MLCVLGARAGRILRTRLLVVRSRGPLHGLLVRKRYHAADVRESAERALDR